MSKADLHIHTTASDGRSTPTEIVALAIEHKLDTIAITDHDTVGGLEEARRAAEGKPIRILTGAEITSRFNGQEAHLLAYCFDPQDSGFKSMIRQHKRARIRRAEWIIGELGKEGMELDIEEVKAEAGGRNVGRPHIASVLVDKGYVGTHKEAFIRYLSDQALGPIPSEYLSHSEVIATVKKAGGAVVVAHPGRLYTIGELEQLVEAGVDGLEVLHPSHYYKLQKEMEAFAGRHKLLITGGSDFHGTAGDYLKYFGVITVGRERIEAMLRMTKQRKEISIS